MTTTNYILGHTFLSQGPQGLTGLVDQQPELFEEASELGGLEMASNALLLHAEKTGDFDKDALQALADLQNLVRRRRLEGGILDDLVEIRSLTATVGKIPAKQFNGLALATRRSGLSLFASSADLAKAVRATLRSHSVEDDLANDPVVGDAALLRDISIGDRFAERLFKIVLGKESWEGEQFSDAVRSKALSRLVLLAARGDHQAANKVDDLAAPYVDRRDHLKFFTQDHVRILQDADARMKAEQTKTRLVNTTKASIHLALWSLQRHRPDLFPK